MELTRDPNLEGAECWWPGEYLGTWFSAKGQVRIDLFDEGAKVVAHVSFPTGLDGATVEDRYSSILRDYAKKKGFSKRLRIIYAEKNLYAQN